MMFIRAEMGLGSCSLFGNFIKGGKYIVPFPQAKQIRGTFNLTLKIPAAKDEAMLT